MVTTMIMGNSSPDIIGWYSQQSYTFTRPSRYLRKLLSLALLCVANGVFAANWEITPEVAIAEIYTDNLQLQPSGDEEDEFVTQLAPAVVAIYDGRGLQSSIDYRMQNLFYNDNSDQNETFHQLDALIQSSLPYNFNVDANASVSQQVTNPENGFTFTNIPINSGQTDVVAVNVNPYWQYVASSGFRTEIRYNRGAVNYDGAPNVDIPDSDLAAADIIFGRWENTDILGWRVMYSKEEIEFDLADTNTFEQASLELSSPVGNGALVFVVFGDEENEYEVAPGEQEPSDTFWSVGLRWDSQRGNAFEVFAGERFFGDYYGLSWTYVGNYNTVELNYSEDLSTDTQAQIENRVFADEGFQLNTQLRPTANVFLRKNIESVLTFSKSRTNFRFALSSETREFQSTGDEDETNFAIISWDWRLGSRTDLISSYNYREDQLGAEGLENRSKEARLGLSRSIGPRTTLDFSTRVTNFSSSNSAIDYRENSLTIEFSREF